MVTRTLGTLIDPTRGAGQLPAAILNDPSTDAYQATIGIPPGHTFAAVIDPAIIATAEETRARLLLVLKLAALIGGAVLLYSLFFASRRD